jgi:superfamily I DNA/RNA helicase
MDGHLPENLDSIFLAEESKVMKDFALVAAGWRRALFARDHQRAISGVARWLGSFEIDEEKQKLLERMGEYLASLKGSINERVNAVTQRNRKSDKDKHGVLLTTMHSSKGLEFDQVWVVGCNDSVIPSPKSINLAEERRLLYVAVTRAKRILHLSATTENKVTPLLTEVGIEINPI